MAEPLRNSGKEDQPLIRLIRAILRDHRLEIANSLGRSPWLARESMRIGATRQTEAEFFFEEICHHLYAGDTPLHVAAAAYRVEVARALIEHGANVSARNRRGAQPLHYAADGSPGSSHWNPNAQAAMIALLIRAGCDPNAVDRSGVAALHRAVRQRCASAVEVLLRGGSSVRLKNKAGSTPLHLAVQNTGRGDTGSAEAKALQKQIIGLLLSAGAGLQDRNARGKTVLQGVQGDWLRAVLEP